MSRVRVGIAVVEWAGCFLVGVRGAGQTLAGRSEFPGGKCGAEESGACAAVRECREETGLEVEAVELLFASEFDYSHAQVALEFWLCRPVGEQVSSRDLRGFAWRPLADLRSLDFPPANEPVINRLVARGADSL